MPGKYQSDDTFRFWLEISTETISVNTSGKGIIQSKSRKGNYLGDAIVEDFFRTQESKLFYLKQYQSLFKLEIAESIITLQCKGRHEFKNNEPDTISSSLFSNLNSILSDLFCSQIMQAF